MPRQKTIKTSDPFLHFDFPDDVAEIVFYLGKKRRRIPGYIREWHRHAQMRNSVASPHKVPVQAAPPPPLHHFGHLPVNSRPVEYITAQQHHPSRPTMQQHNQNGYPAANAGDKPRDTIGSNPATIPLSSSWDDGGQTYSLPPRDERVSGDIGHHELEARVQLINSFQSAPLRSQEAPYSTDPPTSILAPSESSSSPSPSRHTTARSATPSQSSGSSSSATRVRQPVTEDAKKMKQQLGSFRHLKYRTNIPVDQDR